MQAFTILGKYQRNLHFGNQTIKTCADKKICQIVFAKLTQRRTIIYILSFIKIEIKLLLANQNQIRKTNIKYR